MSQTPQKFTCTGDKPQQTDCLDLFSDVAARRILRKAKNVQLTILENQWHTYSCSTLPCFHLLPPTEPWYVCTRKRGSTGKKLSAMYRFGKYLGLAEVGQSELPLWQEIRCCPKFLLTSLYECGSHFRGEEKSAAISLIPPRGPRPQTVDGNVRSIPPRRGEPFFCPFPLFLPLGKSCTLKMRPALICCYALLSVKTSK